MHDEGILIIAIDGPAGVGKSTAARGLAVRLGYRYVDTGSLYRAVAWKVRSAAIEPTDHTAVGSLLSSLSIAIGDDPQVPRIAVNGQDVTADIRTPEVSYTASIVSAIPSVREWLLPVQRQAAEGIGGVVVEGRDIGTKVFPNADVKFFLDASSEVRATRRQRELIAAGHATSLERTHAALQARDHQDRSRPISPLVPAADATIIDTSSLNADDVVERMVALIALKQ